MPIRKVLSLVAAPSAILHATDNRLWVFVQYCSLCQCWPSRGCSKKSQEWPSEAIKCNRLVHQWGLTHIHTCQSCVALYIETVCVAGALADSSDFGLLGSKVHPKCDIPCLGRRWTTLQNLTPLALSSAEKSVTVQSCTQTNSNRYIHTLPIGMCVLKPSGGWGPAGDPAAGAYSAPQ